MGYRLADSIADLTPLQRRVLVALPEYAAKKMEGKESTPTRYRGRRVRSLNDLVQVLPKEPKEPKETNKNG